MSLSACTLDTSGRDPAQIATCLMMSSELARTLSNAALVIAGGALAIITVTALRRYQTSRLREGDGGDAWSTYLRGWRDGVDNIGLSHVDLRGCKKGAGMRRNMGDDGG